ncbi:ATP-binding cassette domain-containing protein [Cochleicola gelatinilyticus]|nr:ATP-binding cassette domain-containing protein [Cochleicola gelatinilyticus]
MEFIIYSMELQLYKVHKSFGTKAIVTDVSFSLKTGEILGLFGRNGSGKSTLLKLIFGTLKADEIMLQLNKVSIAPSEVIKNKHIAYLPQHPFLPNAMRVRDVIPLFFSEEKYQDAIFYDPVIATFTARRIGELSHGQRKYFEVVLLGTLPHPFLFLDEPFSMLEPLQIQSVKEFLRKLQPTKGILITDHYYTEVLDVTTKNIIISEGVSHAITSTEDLKKFKYLRKN